jgi:hypothetical protein
MSGVLNLKGVSLDARSCYIGMAAGLVGGLVAGGAGGGWLLRRRFRAEFDTRFDQEVGAVKAEYNERLKTYLAETGAPFVGGADADTTGWPADNSGDGQTAVGGEQGAASLGSAGGRLQPDDDIQPGDVHRTAYHQVPRRNGGTAADGSVLPGSTRVADGKGPADEIAALVRDAGMAAIDASSQHTEASGKGDGEHDAVLEGLEPDSVADEDSDGEAVVRNVFDDDDSQGPNPVPYGIPAGEFAATPEGYQVLSMTYYAEDGVLIDDSNDQPIDRPVIIAGELSPAGFGGIAGMADTRFVRNEKLEVDIEITLNHGSWIHDKLGYGKTE